MEIRYIKSKTQLIKLLNKIGNKKIDQGIEIKRLSKSVEHYKDKRNLREWLDFVKRILDNSDYCNTNERGFK